MKTERIREIPKGLRSPKSFWFRIQPVLVLAVVFILMTVVVSPKAEFPTNDDWAYARVVKTLLETGQIRLSGIVVASLTFQAFWGALFCLPFGFSFVALRVSTLVMSFLGVLAFYGILRQYGFRRTTALLGTLTLAANPLYVSLSYSFMTEVPALTMMLLAAWFYLHGLRRDRLTWLVSGSICALSAFLIRQASLTMPIGFALWILLACRHVGRPVRKLLAIAAVPAVGVAFYMLWYHCIHGVPPAYNVRRFGSLGVMVSMAPAITFYFMQYLGLFLLPLWAGLLARIWKRLANATGVLIFSAWVLAVSGGLAYVTVKTGARMPYLENMLTDLGLGAQTLRDTLILGLPGPFHLSPWMVSVLSGLATLGAALLGTMATLYLLERPGGGLFRLLPCSRNGIEQVKSKWIAPPAPFLIAGALTLIPCLAIDYIFDRYLFNLIPPVVLLVLLVMRGSRIAVLPMVGMLVIFLAFSLAGVADYMAWNKVRWEAARYAVEELHCPTERIDAGFEWGGWMNYDKFEEVPKPDRSSPVSWWWVRDPKYVVTFNPLPGHTVVKRFPYTSPFSRNPQFLLLSKTPAQDTPDE